MQKDDLVFDVGANNGNRVQPLLNLGTKVVAVEPQEECYKLLKAKFGKKIEIVTMGLGEAEGVKDFYVADTSIISSFSTEWIDSVKNDRFKKNSWAPPIKVQLTTLDKLIEKYGVPRFIKIDVEGYELEVLKGLSSPIEIISFEYTVPEQVNKIIDCLSQIEKNSGKIECNYSIGESMNLTLNNWYALNDFKQLVTSKEFIDTGFGDIYVRTQSLAPSHAGQTKMAVSQM